MFAAKKAAGEVNMMSNTMKKTAMVAVFAGATMLGSVRFATAQIVDNTAAQMDEDKKFVQNAAADGMAQVQLGQLAAQKATNPDVKAFAQKMVDDHTTLQNNLMPVAQRLGVTPPAKLDKKNQAEYDKLSALSGDAFDKAYVQVMVADHKKDLHDFKNEASNTNDRELKSAAKQGAQVIEGHYQMAEKLATQVGTTGAKSANAGQQ
jgi:putative membrane protein